VKTSDSVIGRKVVAWRGDRDGQEGVVVRVDTPYYTEVQWANGDITWYETAALTRPYLLKNR